MQKMTFNYVRCGITSPESDNVGIHRNIRSISFCQEEAILWGNNIAPEAQKYSVYTSITCRDWRYSDFFFGGGGCSFVPRCFQV